MRAGPTLETPREQPRAQRETSVDSSAPKRTDSELLQLLKQKISKIPELAPNMNAEQQQEISRRYLALREEVAQNIHAFEDDEIREINSTIDSRIQTQERKNRFFRFSTPWDALKGIGGYANEVLAARARQGTTMSNLHDGVRGGVQSAALWAAVTRFIPGPWGMVAGIATGIGGTYVTGKLGRFLSHFGIKPETGEKIAQWVTAAGATAVATVGTVATGGLGALGTIGLVGGIGGVSMLLNRMARKGTEDEGRQEMRTKLLEKLRQEQQQAETQMQTAIAADPAGSRLPGGANNPSGAVEPAAPKQLAA